MDVEEHTVTNINRGALSIMTPEKAKAKNSRKLKKYYTRGEEIANSITHGIGAGLSVAGLVILVVFAAIRGDVWRIVSFSIYGATLIILYLASTLYHSLPGPRTKHIFQILDHSSIYLLIAGTYTPFALISLHGPWGWSLFGVIWGLALLGIVFKSLLICRFKKLSVLMYILMGWLCLIVIKPMLVAVPTGGMLVLAGGGLLYTAGVVFYAWRSLKFNHAIWHLFVLAGSVCHYFTILFFVLPIP
jgi:hemolysin III